MRNLNAQALHFPRIEYIRGTVRAHMVELSPSIDVIQGCIYTIHMIVMQERKHYLYFNNNTYLCLITWLNNNYTNIYKCMYNVKGVCISLRVCVCVCVAHQYSLVCKVTDIQRLARSPEHSPQYWLYSGVYTESANIIITIFICDNILI